MGVWCKHQNVLGYIYTITIALCILEKFHKQKQSCQNKKPYESEFTISGVATENNSY